jgi:hypothetical protein
VASLNLGNSIGHKLKAFQTNTKDFTIFRIQDAQATSTLRNHHLSQNDNLRQNLLSLVTLARYCVRSTTVPCSTRFVVVAPSERMNVIG